MSGNVQRSRRQAGWLKTSLWGLGLALGLWACTPIESSASASAPESDALADNSHGLERLYGSPAEVRAHLSGAARITPPDGAPFRRVALQFDGALPALTWRAHLATGWTAPAPVTLTFSEGELHVGRIALPALATEIELTGADDLRAAAVAFGSEPVDLARPLTRDLPRVRPRPNSSAADLDDADGIETQVQALAPADLVVLREQWGARDPGQICNDEVAPYRASIHHTASPADDGGDAAARLRQIQAYHIDGRGFCDIGYHFVVSQAGLIYEGRRGENRPAAHVENENTGNVGICLIGNFEEQPVGEAQFAAATRILKWVLETYPAIPHDRQSVRGHGEHPSASTACPGRNLRARLDDLLAAALDDDPLPPDPVPTGDVAFSVRWTEAPTSAVDPGDLFEAVVRIKNDTAGAIGGVRLGYGLPVAGLLATDYGIYTDAPSRDGSTFMLNDANDAPENPPKDALGASGELTLYAFSAGETKEVRVALRVAGNAEPGPLEARFWVRNINERYTQESFGDRPTLNTFGHTLAGALRLTVFDPEDPEAPIDAGVGGSGGDEGGGRRRRRWVRRRRWLGRNRWLGWDRWLGRRAGRWWARCRRWRRPRGLRAGAGGRRAPRLRGPRPGGAGARPASPLNPLNRFESQPVPARRAGLPSGDLGAGGQVAIEREELHGAAAAGQEHAVADRAANFAGLEVGQQHHGAAHQRLGRVVLGDARADGARLGLARVDGHDDEPVGVGVLGRGEHLGHAQVELGEEAEVDGGEALTVEGVDGLHRGLGGGGGAGGRGADGRVGHGLLLL